MSHRSPALALCFALAACGLPPQADEPAVLQSALTQSTPWAVLLCKFKDDATTPATPMQKIRNFFTASGEGTYNATSYFRDMSHGQLDLSASQVHGWYPINQSTSAYWNENEFTRRGTLMANCKSAAAAAGVPLASYYAVVAVLNVAIGGASGGSYPGIAPTRGTLTDFRYVDNNGTQTFGQEMGHAYGLDHSRREGSDFDYQDQWDQMSTANAFSDADPNYVQRGPGLNAWNMRGMGWLDETRVWRRGGDFEQVVQLTSLHRRDLAGNLAAELGPLENGKGRYLVELRIKERWDSGFPRSAVLVHRFQDNHSYILPGTNGQYDLVAGDVLTAGSGNGPNSRVEVLGIDETARTATVRLSYSASLSTPLDLRPRLSGVARGQLFSLGADGKVWHLAKSAQGAWVKAAWAAVPGGTGLKEIAVSANADGRLEVFAIDANPGLWHAWETAPGIWHDWSPIWGASLKHIAVGTNLDGRLEVFGVTTTGGLTHVAQTAPNGAWGGFSAIAASGGLIDLAVGRNADGRLEVFAIDPNPGLWHIWQTSPGGAWGNWSPLWGATLKSFAVTNDLDGRMEVIGVATDGGLRRIVQNSPNGGWGAFSTLGAFQGLLQHALGRNADGRLEVFAVDAVSGVWHLPQVAPNGGFGTAERWASGAMRYVAAATNPDGRQEVFGLDGSTAGVWHSWQAAANGAWSPWTPLYVTPLKQIAARLADFTPGELFGLGSDGRVWRATRTAQGVWGPYWPLLGNTVGLQEIAVEANADGRLEVFGIDGNSGLWHAWETSRGGAWHDWAWIVGPALKHFAVGRNQDGRLQALGLDANGALVTSAQLAPNGGWSGFSTIGGGGLNQLALTRNFDGRLEVFAIDSNPGLWHISQSAPNGSWGSWSPLWGASLKALTATTSADGRLQVFALNGTGGLLQIGQTSPGSGAFTPFRDVGGTSGVIELAVARHGDGRFEVFMSDGNPGVWRIRQQAPDGLWNTFFPQFEASPRKMITASNPDGRLEVFGVDANPLVWNARQGAVNADVGSWSRIYEQ